MKKSFIKKIFIKLSKLLGYEIIDGLSTSFNYRSDNNNVIGNNDAYKIGLLKENFLPNLNVTLNHSTGYKNPSFQRENLRKTKEIAGGGKIL